MTKTRNPKLSLNPKRFFSYSYLSKNLGFILFVAGLAVIYIWNTHSAERNIREMNVLNKELKELHYKHVTTQAELDNRSLESRVVQMVKPIGLKVSNELPKKLEE